MLAIVPSGFTVPAPAAPRPLPTVVLVLAGAVVAVVDGAVVAVAAPDVVEVVEAAVVTVLDEVPGIVVLTPAGPRTVVVTPPEVTVVGAAVLLVEAPAVVLVDELVELVLVVLEGPEATSLLPRSPGWTTATAVPATKRRPEAPRMSLWVAFRAGYLCRSVGRGTGGGPVGAGDGNRTRTTSLEGWGSSR